jgi:hypothetical protein
LRLKKTLKWVGIVLIVLLVVAQAVRPARTNPAVDQTKTIAANATVSPEVAAILARACNDCHSSNTEWPWYAEVAPVSWLLVDDVNEGREELSLSDWGTYDSKKRVRKLKKICEEVEEGGMPLKSYVLIHPNARLSDSDKQVLCEWTRQETERLPATQ